MEVKHQFALRLKEARRNRGWTQAQLAAEADLQQSAVGRFESASRGPSIENLRRLCVALDVSADFLLGVEQEKGAGSPKAAAVARVMQNLPEDDVELLLVLAEAMRKRNR